jgi:hypothetical protein
VHLCRGIGNSAALELSAKRELIRGDIGGFELEISFERLSFYLHQTCTARMERDEISIVDGSRRVYGIDSLPVADGPVMPCVTNGNDGALLSEASGRPTCSVRLIDLGRKSGSAHRLCACQNSV